MTPGGAFTEFQGGVAPRFTADLGPKDITLGPDGNLWFSQYKNPGAVARITPGDAVTEFTSGFNMNGDQEFITAGPDRDLWFTQSENPGAVVRISPDGTATKFEGGRPRTSPRTRFPRA